MQHRTSSKKLSVAHSAHQSLTPAPTSPTQTPLVPNPRILNHITAPLKGEASSEHYTKHRQAPSAPRVTDQRVTGHVVSRQNPSKNSFTGRLPSIPENTVVGHVIGPRPRVVSTTARHRPPVVVVEPRERQLLVQRQESQAQSVTVERNPPRVPPWLTLPKNVLLRCFQFAKEDDPTVLARIRRVVRSWNNVVMSDPYLWACFTINEHDGKGTALSIAQTFILNSRDAPMTVRYIQWVSPRKVDGYGGWKTIKDSSGRLVSLTLDCMSERGARCHIESLKDIDMPLLENLSITVQRPLNSDNGNFSLELISNTKAPLLQSLTLAVPKLPEPLSISWVLSLKTLSIIDRAIGKEPMSGHALVAFLPACPSLEEFSFDSEKTAPWIKKIMPERIVLNPIPLRGLSCVRFTGHIITAAAFFGNVYLPRLSTFEFNARPGYDLTEENMELLHLQLVQTISNAEQLLTLQLGNVDPWIFLRTRSRSHLRTLKSLHMRLVPNFSILSKLCVSFKHKDKIEYWYLPQLEEIIIEDIRQPHGPKVPGESLGRLIHHRRELFEKFGKGGPVALQSLVVGRYQLLSKTSRGRIKPFEFESLKMIDDADKINDPEFKEKMEDLSQGKASREWEDIDAPI